MSRIVSDIKGFGKQYLRSKVGAFFGFIFPILLVLLFGAIFTASGNQKVSLPVQDLDDSIESHAFIEAMNRTGLVSVETIPVDVNIRDYISDHSLTLALLIPAAFSEEIQNIIASNSSGTANVTLYGDPSQSSTFGTAEAAVETAIVGMNYYLSNAKPVIGMSPPQPASEGLKYMDFFLPGVVGITVMTNSLFSMSSLCGEYRQRNYFKLLATTKLRKHEWLISKFVFYSIILLASLITTFAVAKLAFSIESTITPLALLLIPVGAFVFVSMGMLLGVAVKDPESSAAIANAIGFPMMFLSGAFFPVSSFPSFLQVVAAVMPLTYFNNGLRDTMVYGNSISTLANLGVLLAIGLVFFVLASKLMSWKER
jgi:ABC-2 type transport system permease protein